MAKRMYVTMGEVEILERFRIFLCVDINLESYTFTLPMQLALILHITLYGNVRPRQFGPIISGRRSQIPDASLLCTIRTSLKPFKKSLSRISFSSYLSRHV